MKKFNIIGKYPIISIIAISAIIFLIGPVIFSLIMAIIIVLPMYLAVQIFGNKD
tara:strand:+ start:696 stop:857 length:162 start_codon:yes stop_codon:yes gene_type:complete